jgi:hypothetical protein
MKLVMAVTTQRVEDLSCSALGVDANKGRGGADISENQDNGSFQTVSPGYLIGEHSLERQ